MRELVKSRENYEVINNEFIDHPSKDEEKPPKKSHLTSQLSATKSSRSPRIKKVESMIIQVSSNIPIPRNWRLKDFNEWYCEWFPFFLLFLVLRTIGLLNRLSWYNKFIMSWTSMFNPLIASVALIYKPVNLFAVQINWLVSIWGQHWHLRG